MLDDKENTRQRFRPNTVRLWGYIDEMGQISRVYRTYLKTAQR